MNALALTLVLSAATGDGWIDAVLPVRTGWAELRGGGGYLHAWRDPPLGVAGALLLVSTLRIGVLDRFTVKVLGGELLMAYPEGALPGVVLDLDSSIHWSRTALSIVPTLALRLVWRGQDTLLEVSTEWISTFNPQAHPPHVMLLGPGIQLYRRLSSWVALGLRGSAPWGLPPLPPFFVPAAQLSIRVSFSEHWHAELAGRWELDSVPSSALGATVALVWTPRFWSSEQPGATIQEAPTERCSNPPP